MNSKVKVHVVDGSKMCAGLRADRNEPMPRWPAILGCSGNSVWLLEEKKMNWGRILRLGQKYKEQAETPKYQEGRAQSPAVAEEGVKSSQGAMSHLQVSLSLVAQ